jgi:hypothetical protein
MDLIAKRIREKFGNLVTSWEHPTELGIGVSMMGVPTDPKALVLILEDFGCGPPAAHRILNLLLDGGTKVTTVTWSINVQKVAERLSAIGVNMTIVAPDPEAGHRVRLDHEIDVAAMQIAAGLPAPGGLDPAHLALANQRGAALHESLKRNPCGYGGFSGVAPLPPDIAVEAAQAPPDRPPPRPR